MSCPPAVAGTGLTEPDAAGFVLAGGRSSRMGTDKALAELDGRPLAAHAIAVLNEAGLAAAFAGGQPALTEFAPLIEDRRLDAGPLGGICTALESTRALWAAVLPIDMPRLPGSVVRYLLEHAKVTGRAVTVAAVNGFVQTFPAVLTRSALPVLKRELEAGRRGCFAAFQAVAASFGEPLTAVSVEMLVQAGNVVDPEALPPYRWFLNVNSKIDLGRAQTRIRATIA